MNNLKIIVFIMFSALLCAENIELSIKTNNGNSSYIVESPSQGLKAELIFPFDFATFDLAYTHHFNFFDIKIGSSFLINHKTTTGTDYDWQHNNLTVFSASDNKIDKYRNFKLSISKNITDSLKAVGNFNYQKLDMYWKNTKQEDFVKDETSTTNELTIKYQQKFYQYSLGLNYNYKPYKNLQISLEPSLIYTFVTPKDTHVVRSFYTLQNVKAFGYGLKLNTIYKINNNSKIKLSIAHQMLKDKNVDMDYYNFSDKKYLTYPSSYRYENQTIKIGYIYSF